MVSVFLFLASLSFAGHAAYQVGVPQELLEASGVESINGVLQNREQRSHPRNQRPQHNPGGSQENISQNGFPAQKALSPNASLSNYVIFFQIKYVILFFQFFFSGYLYALRVGKKIPLRVNTHDNNIHRYTSL